jgi:hypothetical protein
MPFSYKCIKKILIRLLQKCGTQKPYYLLSEGFGRLT